MESFTMDAEFLLSSLLGEDSWLDDLSNQDGGKSAIKDQPIDETMATDLFRELEKDSFIGDSNPLPEWMSEKVNLTSWLDVADVKPSELLMDASLPLSSEKMDLVAPTTTTPSIPTEELLDALFVDTRYAPQPPSPGEAQAPDLVALSPASSILLEDESCTSSSVGSPASTVEVEWLDSTAPDMGALSLTTIDLSNLIQAVSPSASCTTTSGFVPITIESSQAVETVPEQSVVSASPKPKSKAKSKLKGVSNPIIRKSKKRDQNKKAATRYRHKKRTEQELLEEERDGLEEKNKELTDKVDSIAREIKYLKDLLAEVYKVKGEIKVMTKK